MPGLVFVKSARNFLRRHRFPKKRSELCENPSCLFWCYSSWASFSAPWLVVNYLVKKTTKKKRWPMFWMVHGCTKSSQNWVLHHKVESMTHILLRLSVILMLTLLFMTAGCESAFKKKDSSGSYAYQKKEFKKMVENDPFPTAIPWGNSSPINGIAQNAATWQISTDEFMPEITFSVSSVNAECGGSNLISISSGLMPESIKNERTLYALA